MTFNVKSDEYARFRPGYPDAFYAWLVTQSGHHSRLWDCACGNGQVAKSMIPYFDEIYASDISSKHWASAWIYWNMILDQDGGPCLVSEEHGDPDDNRQHPVVIVNRSTGLVTYTGLYYYLAHFSRFIRPGATRIRCDGGPSQLSSAAFRNADGSIILVVINNGENITYGLSWKGEKLDFTFKAHSISTLKWNRPAVST